MRVVKASMRQKVVGLPDDLFIIHDQGMDAGQHQEIAHASQFGVFNADTTIIRA